MAKVGGWGWQRWEGGDVKGGKVGMSKVGGWRWHRWVYRGVFTYFINLYQVMMGI